MEQYLPVVVLAVLAVVFVLVSIAASRLLAPRRATAPKIASYECGITDQAALPERYPVRFYLVAMLFIMFDIEIVFLYPWAVANKQLGLFGFLSMLLFVAIFFLSFVYELAMGGLEWGPVRRALLANPTIGFNPAQASGPAQAGKEDSNGDPGTTYGVRQVGLEGRHYAPAQPTERQPAPVAAAASASTATAAAASTATATAAAANTGQAA